MVIFSLDFRSPSPGFRPLPEPHKYQAGSLTACGPQGLAGLLCLGGGAGACPAGAMGSCR